MRQLGRVLGVLMLAVALWVGSVIASPPQQANLFEAFIKDVRDDLELLAGDVFGGIGRPANWTGNSVLDSRTVVADLWYDTEQLADQVFGPGQRPPDWFGATSSNAELVSRNIRHDLELLADQHYNNIRPDGWVGAPLIYRCDRTLQNVLYLLNTIYNVRPQTPEGVGNYCAAVQIEIDADLVELTFGSQDLQNQVPDLILAVRGDLERLADEGLGLGSRPDGWVGNKDINSPTLINDNFTDLENLADTFIAPDQRPEGWIGFVSGSAPVSYRNLRHDLELLADVRLGLGVRPTGWQGEDLLLSCEPLLQNLVVVLQQNYDFIIDEALASAPDYCGTLETAANFAAENPPAIVIEEVEEDRFVGESEYAFAYLDLAALDYMGVMPSGTQFRAWYRNFGESNMMFVSGDDFAVFIDRRWTTIERDLFEQLPTLEGIKPLTFCDARWCNGPGPTPTPTGGGPLFEVINAATPPATIEPGQVQDGGKQLVSWNHIRINYLLQKPEIKAAQVTLEICKDVQQIACEPVQTAFNNATGTAFAVISQFNGLNVYELPYGYTTNLLIEGATLFSTDIWLNDPALLTPVATPG